nr:reverse transcriptase domain-containing protein [Tanacetum cinerariifolium]
MLKVLPWKEVVRFGKRGKLNPRYVGSFKVLERVGDVAYKVDLPEELSRVHNTFHVSNLKKCHADEPLVVPLDGLHFDDKLHFVEEPMKIVDHEVKWLKRSRIPLVKMNTASSSGLGTIPSNTTRSGNAYQGPTIPTTSSSPKVVERETEVTKDPTGRALIDVYEGELTLRVSKEVVTFNLDQTSRYSAKYDAMSVNQIDLIDVACEETFAYCRMPFGLCNAPGTFQRCMMAIFYDMIEIFMDDFSVFGNSFGTCLSHLDKMLKRCEDTNLCLNWKKSHFLVKEGIVLGHKISKNGIEVDKAKVDVIAKLPHPTTVKGGEAIINSIKNDDQPLPHVTQVSIAGTSSNEKPPLKDKSMWSDQEKRIQKIDRLARSLLIQGLSNDIYSLIDSNKTAKELWDAFARHMLGSEYEGKQYAAMMRQNKNLININIDALYNILKKNQGDVNDAMGSKKKIFVVTSGPLALIADKTNVSRSKERVIVSLDSEGSETDDFSELKKITALLAKAFN